ATTDHALAADADAGTPADFSEPLAFMRLLWALDHALRAQSKQMHRHLGLTGPQRLVLRMVGRGTGATPSELARLLHLDRSTVTGIVNRLVQRKLIARETHPADRRRAVLRLTAIGARADKNVEGTVEVCMRRALASLSPNTVRATREALEVLTWELEQEVRHGRA
ncbi:MAG: MarR family transcriptional regulator, partial [Myxococcales bacterium]|nr:MarR family transcriptional regulator [Myxococcales bacterium]